MMIGTEVTIIENCSSHNHCFFITLTPKFCVGVNDGPSQITSVFKPEFVDLASSSSVYHIQTSFQCQSQAPDTEFDSVL